MDIILHAVGWFLIVLVLLALFGKRSLSDVTIFDFVILLLISQVVESSLSARNASTRC